MNYDTWRSTEPDPFGDMDRTDDEPPCDFCEALPGEPCELFCCCLPCDRRRQREMDEREQDGKEVA
jgi:hypothetical protein